MRWLALIAGLVFTASGLKALLAYDAATAVVSRPVLLGVSALCALVFFFLFARAGQSTREVSHFEQWLQANAQKTMAGGATYNGRKVTPDTEVKRFLLTVSVVIMTFKIPSRYYFATRDNFQLTQALDTLASLLLGRSTPFRRLPKASRAATAPAWASTWPRRPGGIDHPYPMAA